MRTEYLNSDESIEKEAESDRTFSVLGKREKRSADEDQKVIVPQMYRLLRHNETALSH